MSQGSGMRGMLNVILKITLRLNFFFAPFLHRKLALKYFHKRVNKLYTYSRNFVSLGWKEYFNGLLMNTHCVYSSEATNVYLSFFFSGYRSY